MEDILRPFRHFSNGNRNYIILFDDRMFIKEPWFCPAHGMVFVTSGAMEAVTGEGKKTIVKAGDVIFYRKYQVLRFLRIMDDDPYSEIVITFTEPFLRDFFRDKEIGDNHDNYENVVVLSDNPLYKSIRESLVGYFENETFLGPDLLETKTREALLILLQERPELIRALADFPQPGKINLEEFMNKNFVFNESIDHFAELTGRSLAAFKRDFQKVFNSSPQKWMQKKRLEKAHLLIKEMGQKPVDFYLDIGFENLSHFSTAFKKEFGYNSSLLQTVGKNS